MEVNIREIHSDEYLLLGELMVDVYSKIKGFPSSIEQPDYYENLRKVGDLSQQSHTSVLVAALSEKKIMGGVVEKEASGIRLLCVSPESRGLGGGKKLTNKCIELAKISGNKQVILHTTEAMEVAWSLYEKIGFRRSEDLDFLQGNLQVFGFRLMLVDE